MKKEQMPTWRRIPGISSTDNYIVLNKNKHTFVPVNMEREVRGVSEVEYRSFKKWRWEEMALSNRVEC